MISFRLRVVQPRSAPSSKALGGVRSLVCAALAAILSTPLAPISPAAATTTVAVEGTVVTITVPIDVFGDLRMRDPETGNVTTAGPYWEKGAEKIWNDDLGRLPYRDCLTLRLDIDIREYPGGGTGRPGAHQIDFHNNPGVRSGVFDPSARTKHDDTTTPFGAPLNGQFGPIDYGTVAHEVGHLLGLGDDYADEIQPDGPPRSHPLPGRDGTLMADSSSENIDQALVDRIASLLQELDKLPECWSGTMRSETTRDYEGLGTCSDVWQTELRMTVALDGKVTGDGTARLVDGPTCTFPFPAIVELPPLRVQTMTVAGTADEVALKLRLTPEPGDATGTHGVVTGFTSIYNEIYGGEPLVIPKGTPCRAIGQPETRSTALDYGGDLHVSRNSIELICSELAFR